MSSQTLAAAAASSAAFPHPLKLARVLKFRSSPGAGCQPARSGALPQGVNDSRSTWRDDGSSRWRDADRNPAEPGWQGCVKVRQGQEERVPFVLLQIGDMKCSLAALELVTREVFQVQAAEEGTLAGRCVGR